MIEKIIKDGVLNPEDFFSFSSQLSKEGRKAVCIDATFVLPSSEENLYENFLKCRMPDAQFLDLSLIRDTSSHLPNMLPSLDVFTAVFGKLGVCAGDVVVLYGQNSLTMGPARAWWMLRGFGYMNVVVLNGALSEWQRSGGEVETGGLRDQKVSSHSVKLKLFDKARIANLDDVQDISDKKSGKIVDARPAARFSGEVTEPRAEMRSGHIPHSVNVPCSSILDGNGRLKSKSDLEDILCDGDMCQSEAPLILTCGSGITACALALAYYHIGVSNFKVYDGSWSEWGREDSPTRVDVL